MGSNPILSTIKNLGLGTAWGGHLSGRQDNRWVRIPQGPPKENFKLKKFEKT